MTVPYTYFINSTLERLVECLTIKVSTKNQLACLQGRSFCCTELLACDAVHIECGRAGSALQNVQGKVVPLVVAEVLA